MLQPKIRAATIELLEGGGKGIDGSVGGSFKKGEELADLLLSEFGS